MGTNALVDELSPLVTATQLVVNSGGALRDGDPRLEEAALGASAAVRRYCKWHVTPQRAETFVLDGTGGRVIRVPSMNVVDLVSLKILGQEVPEHAFSWSQMGMIELHAPGLVFPKRFRSVEVVVMHGFEAAPDLTAIASQVALHALASPMGRTREQAGQVSVVWGTAQGMAWSESALEMMKPYRLVSLP